MVYPSVAVVIPAKNEAKYLPVLLSALAEQTLRPAEVVVADGGSVDGTREVAEKLGARVIIGGGVAEGRNAGAAATLSDVLVFFDADALIDDPQFLERAVAEFTRRKLDIASADLKIIGGNAYDRAMYAFFKRYARWWGNRHPHPIGTFIMATRKLHDAVHGFDPQVKYGEDNDYGVRAKRTGFTFGIFDDVTVGITMRRLERDGRIRFSFTNIFAALYIFTFGPIKTDIFRYRFGYGEHREDVIK